MAKHLSATHWSSLGEQQSKKFHMKIRFWVLTHDAAKKLKWCFHWGLGVVLSILWFHWDHARVNMNNCWNRAAAAAACSVSKQQNRKHLIQQASHICSGRWCASLWSCQTVVRLRSWLHARLQQLLASSGHLDLGHQPGTCDTPQPNTASWNVACNAHTGEKAVQYTLYCTLGKPMQYMTPHYTVYVLHILFTPNMASIPRMLWFGGERKGMCTKPLPREDVEINAEEADTAAALSMCGLSNAVWRISKYSSDLFGPGFP